MTRRSLLAMASAAAVGAAAPPAPVPRSSMGFSPDCFVIGRPSRSGTVLDYLKYAWERGAGGVQGYLAPNALDAAGLKALRDESEKLGMYLEITTQLPKDDAAVADFESTVKAARECGAKCMRSVCLSGRRYETFNDLPTWQTFMKDSKAKLARAVKVLERNKMPLGLENHKDWTVEQMVPLLKSYSSEYLGTCIDWGNNMSLCDDPVDVVNELAPFCINSHIKDMAVEEYADGFYLAEVPLGQGMLPLKQMLDTILAKRPNVKFSLDMLTRNPLLVPCLTEKYWLTHTERNGVYLARTLRLIRANKPKKPLVWVDKLDQPAKVKFEQDNIAQCVAFARDGLGMKM
jgi:3-oxoisoapionate decarboxylase